MLWLGMGRAEDRPAEHSGHPQKFTGYDPDAHFPLADESGRSRVHDVGVLITAPSPRRVSATRAPAGRSARDAPVAGVLPCRLVSMSECLPTRRPDHITTSIADL